MAEASYLQRLKFDPNLLKSFIAKYLSNIRIALLLIFAIAAFGMQSFFSLPRVLNPSIKIPIVIVSTVLPGAGPTEMEDLVTVPIEDSIRGVTDIKTVTSTSQENVSVITAEFNSGIDPEKAKTDVQSAVDGITSLPEDALDPNVLKLDFENQPIWTFNLTGKDKANLIRFSRTLQKDLDDLPSISNVQINGLDEQEIQIVIKPETVASYSFNPLSLTGALKTALSSFPGGSIKTENSIFSITINPTVITTDDIRNLKINIGGSVVSLSDIADVQEISKPDQPQSYVASSKKPIQESVSFNVFRVTTTNIDRADKEAKDLVEQKLKEQEGKFALYTVLNANEQITKEYAELIKDISLTVFLVFLILLIFLGGRQAIISMLSVPLTFLITFSIMRISGIDLSFIATFAMLLSLGLLVDDTIVVISAMTAYYRTRKFTPLQTGLLVWKDFWVAILTTTLTTVWAFVPLLLSAGIIGEFIKAIPIVVSATLLGSLVVALFITLPLMIFLLKPTLPKRVKVVSLILIGLIVLGSFAAIVPKSSILPLQIIALFVFAFIASLTARTVVITLAKKSKLHPPKSTRLWMREALDTGFINFQKVEQGYSRLMNSILKSKGARRKTIIMVGIFAIFSYLLVPLGFVKNEFFPKVDQNNLYISVELPAGTNLEQTSKESLALFEKIKDTPETKFISLDQGRGFSGNMGSGGAASNNFLYSLALVDTGKRKESSIKIAQDLRGKFANYNRGKLSVIEQSGGPPAGADIQIKLFGSDLQVLDSYANKIQDYLKTQPGITNIDKSIKPGTSKFIFVPDKSKLAEQNLTVDMLGSWLRLYASGIKADNFTNTQEDGLSQDITIRLGSQTQSASGLSSINIPTQNGSIPLGSLGTIKLGTNPTLITRESGKRTLSVTAGVTPGYNLAEKNAALGEFTDSLNLPSGYSWATGGTNEENQESINSILTAMILSVILIILTLVLQFSSFRKAFIVISVIPLSVSGVFIIFALTQTPLSFPALIGILALFGIVVKNSILIVDKILINRKTDMEFTNSIVDAATSRLEPIALTSIAAIVGLIPITLSDPLWRGLGGAIIAGLAFSGTIMLFFIPVVYYEIYKNSEGR